MSKKIFKHWNTKIIILLIGCGLAGFIFGFIFPKNFYYSRQAFCSVMAKKYLEDFASKEAGGDQQKWLNAIDKETQMYNLCVSDFSK